MKVLDTIIIGGGQAGLSAAYFMRRSGLDYLVLDNQEKAGGSWLHTWDSLRLFSPVQYSSLSGWMMPPGKDEYPGKQEFIDYLTAYEERYKFPIERPVVVKSVTKEGERFRIATDKGEYLCKSIISATGTASNPFVPSYPQQDQFKGLQIHSSAYRSPADFEGQKVLIVGGGNSGAQILAEVSKVAQTQWVTMQEPNFLPEEIDGRFLFQEATNKFLKKPSNNPHQFTLADIVQLAPVKEGIERGVMTSRQPFQSFYEDGVVWPDGEQEAFDSVIWCTGFKASLGHLAGLGIVNDGKVETKNLQSVKEPNLWLVGYGNWTGFASATIYGVGKTVRYAVGELVKALGK